LHGADDFYTHGSWFQSRVRIPCDTSRHKLPYPDQMQLCFEFEGFDCAFAALSFGTCVEAAMDSDFLQHLDLSPANADQIPPSGLASVAKPGDHIARKSRSEPFWHHGIMKGAGESLGTFLVIDSFPHEGQPSVQTRTLDDFLGDDVEAAAIVRWGGQQELGRQLALYSAEKYEAANSERWHLSDNNCEAFATLCWTGRSDFEAVTILLHKLHLHRQRSDSKQTCKVRFAGVTRFRSR